MDVTYNNNNNDSNSKTTTTTNNNNNNNDDNNANNNNNQDLVVPLRLATERPRGPDPHLIKSMMIMIITIVRIIYDDIL